MWHEAKHDIEKTATKNSRAENSKERSCVFDDINEQSDHYQPSPHSSLINETLQVYTSYAIYNSDYIYSKFHTEVAPHILLWTSE